MHRVSWMTLASPNRSRICSAMLALLGCCALAIQGSCTKRPTSKGPCQGTDLAQCEFERAIDQAKAQEAEKQAQAQREREQTQLQGWAWADALVEEFSGALGDGMDAEIVHSRTEKHCGFELGANRNAQESWVCTLASPLELGGARFVLEYSPDGVLSLASDRLDAELSQSLLEAAVRRWRPLCQAQQFEQVEGQTHHQIYRCALSGGPLLVLGRFDRDLAADRWQLSFAMVAVG